MRKILKNKSIIMLIAVVMMFATLVGCSPSNKGTEETEVFNVSITDSTGTTITLDKKPEKIVSLAPSTTEILYFLGVEDKIVGRTNYCSFPESMEAVPSVGKTSDPNIEAIVELAPDLIVASTHVSNEVITKLREVGLNVAFLNEQDGFEGTYSAITNIGALIGEEEAAEAVIVDMKQKVEDVITKVNALGKENKPKVYYAVGYGEKDSTAGGTTFIGEIITLAGGDNVSKDIDGWSISKEQIAENEPDMIIMPSGRDMAEGMKTTAFYKDLKAVQAGELYEIDGDMISRQGPRVADALAQMAKTINPEME